MQNLKVTPNTISEGRAMNYMFDGFKKAHANRNNTVIVVGQAGTPYIFSMAQSDMHQGVALCQLRDDNGAILAICRMDQNDR